MKDYERIIKAGRKFNLIEESILLCIIMKEKQSFDSIDARVKAFFETELPMERIQELWLEIAPEVSFSLPSKEKLIKTYSLLLTEAFYHKLLYINSNGVSRGFYYQGYTNGGFPKDVISKVIIQFSFENRIYYMKVPTEALLTVIKNDDEKDLEVEEIISLTPSFNGIIRDKKGMVKYKKDSFIIFYHEFSEDKTSEEESDFQQSLKIVEEYKREVNRVKPSLNTIVMEDDGFFTGYIPKHSYTSKGIAYVKNLMKEDGKLCQLSKVLENIRKESEFCGFEFEEHWTLDDFEENMDSLLSCRQKIMAEKKVEKRAAMLGENFHLISKIEDHDYFFHYNKSNCWLYYIEPDLTEREKSVKFVPRERIISCLEEVNRLASKIGRNRFLMEENEHGSITFKEESLCGRTFHNMNRDDYLKDFRSYFFYDYKSAKTHLNYLKLDITSEKTLKRLYTRLAKVEKLYSQVGWKLQVNEDAFSRKVGKYRKDIKGVFWNGKLHCIVELGMKGLDDMEKVARQELSRRARQSKKDKGLTCKA